MLKFGNCGAARAWGGKGGSALPPIDWQKVSKKFGGIEFNPYKHQVIKPIKDGKKQILIMWYNTVDVPSRCIWNLKPIVENIQKMSRSELSANLKNLSNK